MKKIFFILASLILVLFLNALYAGVEHTAYGKIFNSDDSVPAGGDITFVAFIKARPSETQTQASTGSAYSDGYWVVACGDFPTAWEAGDVLHVDVTNIVNGETGSVEVTLTDEAGNDPAPDLHLEFVVPVELVSFKAIPEKDQVLLKWSTATESNNFGFEVQRKYERGEYCKIGFVPGNGTTTILQDYNFTDTDVASGKYYYRLKQIDFDGSFKICGEEVVVMALPNDYTLENNYPNPFNGATKIRYHLPKDDFVTLQIFDITGRLVKTLVNTVKPAGLNEVVWDGKDDTGIGLASGMYMYKIQVRVFRSAKKLLFLK